MPYPYNKIYTLMILSKCLSCLHKVLDEMLPPCVMCLWLLVVGKILGFRMEKTKSAVPLLNASHSRKCLSKYIPY